MQKKSYQIKFTVSGVQQRGGNNKKQDVDKIQPQEITAYKKTMYFMITYIFCHTLTESMPREVMSSTVKKTVLPTFILGVIP